MERKLNDGLKAKYNVYKTSDGTMVNNCFVLLPDKDPSAVIALQAYANATSNPDLSKDILEWVGSAQTVDPVHAAGACYCRECRFRKNSDECPLLYFNQRELDEHDTSDTDFCSYGERKQNEITHND